MAFSQKNRPIAIATPLGQDKLLLQSITIREQLGRPFEMKAELVSEEPTINFLEIVGKAVTIRWTLPSEGSEEKKRMFSGYVSSFVQRPRGDALYQYEATIVPW